MTFTAQSKTGLADRCSDLLGADTATAFKAAEVVVVRSSLPGFAMTDEDRRRPGRLRRFGSAHLRLWKLGRLADSAEVLISELVTNAFCHSEGPEVALRITHRASEVRIEVHDGSPRRPHERTAGPEEEGGRGMTIVASIADAWGVSDDGTLTWCTLAVPHKGREQ